MTTGVAPAVPVTSSLTFVLFLILILLLLGTPL